MATNSSEFPSLHESQTIETIQEIQESITSSYMFLHTLKEQKIAISWFLTIEKHLSKAQDLINLRKILLKWLDIMLLSRQLVSPFNEIPSFQTTSIEYLRKLATQHNTKKIIQEIDLIQSEKLHVRKLNDSELLLNVVDDEDDTRGDDTNMPDWLQGARQLKRHVKRVLKEYYAKTRMANEKL